VQLRDFPSLALAGCQVLPFTLMKGICLQANGLGESEVPKETSLKQKQTVSLENHSTDWVHVRLCLVGSKADGS
jgi:hypothetical protein